MSKITYEQKIELLDRYKGRPMGASDPDVITAIKIDVIKCSSKGAPKGPVVVAEQHDNTLYNKAMGIYRNFLKARDSHLDMTGAKARWNAEAMRNILEFIRKFAGANGRPNDDEHVLIGLQFMFDNWDRLNDFHRNRLGLPDIHKKIEEILPMIKNGYDKRTTAKNQVNDLESRIKAKQQQAGTAEA